MVTFRWNWTIDKAVYALRRAYHVIDKLFLWRPPIRIDAALPFRQTNIPSGSKNRNKMATAKTPNSRLQNGHSQTNGWCRGGYVHFFIRSMVTCEFTYSANRNMDPLCLEMEMSLFQQCSTILLYTVSQRLQIKVLLSYTVNSLWSL